jgi:hypothetical protein
VKETSCLDKASLQPWLSGGGRAAGSIRPIVDAYREGMGLLRYRGAVRLAFVLGVRRAHLNRRGLRSMVAPRVVISPVRTVLFQHAVAS